MYTKLQLARKYLRYYITAANSRGHGIHSPFVYALVTKVLNDGKPYAVYQQLEQERNNLLQCSQLIEVDDYGAGSVTGMTRQRSVKAIAASALKPPKFAQLLHRLVQYLQPAVVLELGTSLGITTAYMAAARPETTVLSLEGAPAIANMARQTFDRLQLQNIQLITGNFDDTLAAVTGRQFGLIFMDGNHRKEPTLRYFNQLLACCSNDTVVVVDDIHWSREMEEAWQAIQQHPAVTLTIDLFFVGLVFFRQEQHAKEHFVIRF